ncbi:MAG: Fic/DOC family N-terminal domain-containing protein, partial [Pseudomonadota bacterium]
MHEPDVSEAVKYDYDAFPPNGLDAQKLLDPLSSAVASITRYDVLLGQMRDSELLLAPLRRQEAVVSSRMEGTITTLEEVLTLEADQDPEKDIDVGRHRPDAIETLSYARALRLAQYRMKAGQKISESLIKSIHHELLRPGRGYNLDPGRYKIEQNYL